MELENENLKSEKERLVIANKNLELEHGLTTAELNYVCLYAIGLRGKDVGNYMKMRSHVNVSSAIRRKLGIDQHETNIGIFVRKKLREF